MIGDLSKQPVTQPKQELKRKANCTIIGKNNMHDTSSVLFLFPTSGTPCSIFFFGMRFSAVRSR